MDKHTGDFTIYTNHDSGIGWQAIEVSGYRIEAREHVYEGITGPLAVHYVPKRGRRERALYSPATVRIVAGHGHPKAPSMWADDAAAFRKGRFNSADVDAWTDMLDGALSGLEVVYHHTTTGL